MTFCLIVDFQPSESKTSSFVLLKSPSIIIASLGIIVASLIWSILDPTLEPHLREVSGSYCQPSSNPRLCSYKHTVMVSKVCETGCGFPMMIVNLVYLKLGIHRECQPLCWLQFKTLQVHAFYLFLFTVWPWSRVNWSSVLSHVCILCHILTYLGLGCWQMCKHFIFL